LSFGGRGGTAGASAAWPWLKKALVFGADTTRRRKRAAADPLV
jgi:hypothetical protein